MERTALNILFLFFPLDWTHITRTTSQVLVQFIVSGNDDETLALVVDRLGVPLCLSWIL